MSDAVGAHSDLHSEQGARAGEHSGPVAEPADQGARHRLAGVREARPRARRGVRAGVRLHHGAAHRRRTAAARHRRGRALRDRAPRPASRFVGIAFAAAATTPTYCGWPTRPARRPGALPEAIGGLAVDLTDPSGIPVHVVAGMHALPALPGQQPHVFNFGHELRAHQRHPTPAARARPGCSGWATSCCRPPGTLEALNWYLDNLGMIVSDFLYFPASVTAVRP